ncbi:hypothetical protein GWI33_003189 [Rhynchophorus ferrugineus]|uniref:Bardet-Biedl syndrome 4 protein n=1 Tax=Rhynchophorus ferrugineus TaxID=354439 RepID=A0A834ITL4_RHYFE|nr:hypothetical protein GWI33_003189 [Rhynchophorus ferrugineus]
MLSNGKSHLSSAKQFEKPKDAIEVCEPIPIEKLNWLIHLQHIRGETEFCKKLIASELNRSNGKNEYAFYKQGIILKEEGKIQDALETFQKCLKLNPKSVVIMKEIAKCLYDMRRYRLALNAYMEAESLLKTSDWKLCYFIAQCCFKLGHVEKAKEYAHKSVKMGKQEQAYALLIKILGSEHDLKSALAVSNAATECCPDSVNMLTESGLLFLKAGQAQYAFERLSQALALDPAYAKALLGIGCITMRHEEYEVALTKFKIAVLHEPESVALWNNIGICFYAKQKLVAAISCLKRALWISPLNWKIIFNLAIVYLATQQPASAFNFACASVNLRPDVAECFAILAYTLFYLKDVENALKAMTHACTLSPNNTAFTANAALMSKLLGQSETADRYMTTFRQLVDSGENVADEVAKLVENIRLACDQNPSQTPVVNNLEDNMTHTQSDNNVSGESSGKSLDEDEV